MATFIFYNFMKTIPKEIDESAVIDGASTFRTFRSIIFPLLKSVTVTVIVLDVMWIWNDFLLPYLLLGSSNKTLSVAIQLTMQGAYGAIDWGGFMAMLVLAIIPIIIFYLLCQKYIIKGVIDGAVKG